MQKSKGSKAVYTLDLRERWWELLCRLADEEQVTKNEMIRRALDFYDRNKG